jgi:peptidoglycan/LPS O-acetylase OafA/YrhL
MFNPSGIRRGFAILAIAVVFTCVGWLMADHHHYRHELFRKGTIGAFAVLALELIALIWAFTGTPNRFKVALALLLGVLAALYGNHVFHVRVVVLIGSLVVVAILAVLAWVVELFPFDRGPGTP